MKILSPDAGPMSEVISLLRKGGIIAHPADTCFGLAGDLMNEEALKKLQQIKGREASKPMSIMLPAYMKAELSRYVMLSDFAEMVCDALLPGPITIVLPKGPDVPQYYFPDSPTVGIRIPYDPFIEDLLTRFHGPLITTSANLSGQPVCHSSGEVIKAFHGQPYQPDLLIEGKIAHLSPPSTVISLQNDSVTILREGPLKKGELEALLGVSIR